jgi:hypothetical protein
MSKKPTLDNFNGPILIIGGISSILLSIVENGVIRSILKVLGSLTFTIQRLDKINLIYGIILIVVGVLARFPSNRRPWMFITIGMLHTGAGFVNIIVSDIPSEMLWAGLGVIQVIFGAGIIKSRNDI